jgi:DNA-binding NarL/FixJ family response regulator
MKPVRLVVVDDHVLFRAGLVSLLTQMPGMVVVGEAGNGREALNIVRQTDPDVVLLDVNMPVMGGVETVSALKAGGKWRILMLTISKNDEDLFGAIIAGADGYLLKNAEPEELRRSILLVNNGKSVLSPDVTSRVLRAVTNGQALQPEVGLSRREMEVLECLAQGMTSSQIAASLYISENTVKTHVRHILEKLEAANRAEAVSKAVHMGLIKMDSSEHR